jgi:Pyruvate/2-oxoacid:ferredoxin oxidoreductase delta subunit
MAAQVLEKYANWPLIDSVRDKPTMISGRECKIYKLDAKCRGNTTLVPGISLPLIDDVAACAGCGTCE